MPLPTRWKVATLDELKAKVPRSCAAGPFGSSISAQYFVESGVPVIRGGNLSDAGVKFIPENFVFITEDRARTFKGAQVVAGDLVFTCWGTLGQVGLIPSDGPFDFYVISNKQLKLRPNTEICSAEFLFYYFSTEHLRRHFQDIAIGSAVPGINLGLLKRVKVPLPPLVEQKKIAAILTAYDDLIENNKRRIALLEKMAEEIYREWFVRLRFPGHASTRTNKSMPEGWQRISLMDLCRLKRGYDLPHHSMEVGTHPVIGATGVSGAHSKFKVQPPVVTTGRSGSLGTVVWSDEPSWPLNTTLYVRDFFGNSPYFVFHTLTNAQLGQFNAGAGVPTLNRNHLSSVKLLKPPATIQSEFDRVLEPIAKQAATLRHASVNLQKTRDLLLGRLISGKLRVDQLDIQFPPSMREST